MVIGQKWAYFTKPDVGLASNAIFKLFCAKVFEKFGILFAISDFPLEAVSQEK